MGRSKAKISIGATYSQWTVIGELLPAPYNGCYMRKFLCRCLCGKEKEVFFNALQRGASNACSNECRDPAIGKVFGTFLVMTRVSNEKRPNNGTKETLYEGRCIVCGYTKINSRYRLGHRGCLKCRKNGHIREIAVKQRELYDPSKIFDTGDQAR